MNPRGAMMKQVAILVLVALASCRGERNPLAPPPSARIAVVPFAMAEKLEAERGPYAGLGSKLAERIVKELRDRDRTAVMVSNGTPPDADVVVRGRITRIEGGSRALRAMINMGAGGATLGTDGQVTNRD